MADLRQSGEKSKGAFQKSLGISVLDSAKQKMDTAAAEKLARNEEKHAVNSVALLYSFFFAALQGI
jgi:hypothetical protein